jgi:molybdate transport system regulatory protein
MLIAHNGEVTMLAVKSKVWIEKDGGLVFGAGRERILKAIERTGSINRAGREIGMSYRRIWSYLKSVEARLPRALVETQQGGKKGGGATVTAYGRKWLTLYEKLEKEVTAFTDKRYREIFIKNKRS